jgi:hypothetical protein
MRTCPDPERALPPWLIYTLRTGLQVSMCISIYMHTCIRMLIILMLLQCMIYKKKYT